MPSSPSTKSFRLTKTLMVLLRSRDMRDLVTRAREAGMSRSAYARNVLADVLGWEKTLTKDGGVPPMQGFRKSSPYRDRGGRPG